MSEILQSQETVRLYEYEPCKPDLEDYIEHHGVKDMHWGVRNGPPYPLSSKVSTGSRLKKGAKGTGGSYGGNPDRLKKKAAKAAVKAAKANKKAAQAGNSLLHPFKAKKKDKLQTKAFRAQAKADKLNAKLDKEELKEKSKQKVEEVKRQRKINEEVADAKKTGNYDMEFLERNLDTDQKTGEPLKGKALDDAYRKFLDERGFPGVEGRGKSSDTKYGGKMSEVAMQKAEKLQEKYKKLSYEDAMKVVTGQKKLDDVVKKTFSEKRRDKKEQEKRAQSLEKARQTKAENTAKKKAEAEEKEKISKMREEAIKKADIVTMYKNATHFSNEEIQAALDRKGTLDRLAAEISKSVPKTETTTVAPKKEKYFKNMVKQKTTEGAKAAAESVVKNVANQALKMTLEQLALTASGTATNDKWNDNKKLEERRKNILRLIKA